MPTRLQAVATTPLKMESASLYSIFWRRSATSAKKTKKVGGLCKAKESEAGAFEELGHLSSALQARRFSTFVPLLPGQSTPYITRINRDDFGGAAFPTIHAVGKVIEQEKGEMI